MDVSWTAVAAAFVFAVGTLFLRRLLPEDGRKRGKLPILFLIASVFLRLIAVPIEALQAPHGFVLGFKLAAAILLTMGLSGSGGMILFDLMLLRVGVRVPSILRGLLVFVAFVIAVMALLRQSGANLLSLVTTGTVLTAVVGLALQEPIGNLFAGLSLQIDGTLAVGDWIKFGERIGRIERISFRATTVSTRDDDTITVPNRHFTQHEVLNYSRPTTRHRMWCEFQMAYRHPPNEVKQVFEAALAGCPGVLQRPTPHVVVRGFGDHGVDYVVLYFIEDFARDVLIESEVRTRLWYAAQRHGFEFPFPIRTVHMHQVTSESRRAVDERDYMERLGSLSKIDLFKSCADADVDLLARGMLRRIWAKGETLVRQGAPGDSLFLIASGDVGVVLSVDGAERQVATIQPGNILGEMSLLTGEPRAASCVALTDVVTHEISHDLFQRLLEQNPGVIEVITGVLSERQTSLDSQREGLSQEAHKSRRDETRQRLLTRIRGFFHLG